MHNWFKSNKLTLIIGLFILIMSVVPSSGLPRYNIAFADKIVHIAMYFILGLALVADRWLSRKVIDFKRQTVTLVMLFTFVFGSLLEVVQWFLPYRSASVFDILANIAGAILALILMFIGYWLWQNKPRRSNGI